MSPLMLRCRTKATMRWEAVRFRQGGRNGIPKFKQLLWPYCLRQIYRQKARMQHWSCRKQTMSGKPCSRVQITSDEIHWGNHGTKGEYSWWLSRWKVIDFSYKTDFCLHQRSTLRRCPFESSALSSRQHTGHADNHIECTRNKNITCYKGWVATTGTKNAVGQPTISEPSRCA